MVMLKVLEVSQATVVTLLVLSPDLQVKGQAARFVSGDHTPVAIKGECGSDLMRARSLQAWSLFLASEGEGWTDWRFPVVELRHLPLPSGFGGRTEMLGVDLV